eukprot:GGOE01027148.1.p1 GENE.GGOE01027148.1~~GGOE01027148.1.p1  ORF type:complete len:286 (+),score=15.11 GGOE01027148.1:1535-2392(+)
MCVALSPFPLSSTQSHDIAQSLQPEMQGGAHPTSPTIHVCHPDNHCGWPPALIYSLSFPADRLVSPNPTVVTTAFIFAVRTVSCLVAIADARLSHPHTFRSCAHFAWKRPKARELSSSNLALLFVLPAQLCRSPSLPLPRPGLICPAICVNQQTVFVKLCVARFDNPTTLRDLVPLISIQGKIPPTATGLLSCFHCDCSLPLFQPPLRSGLSLSPSALFRPLHFIAKSPLDVAILAMLHHHCLALFLSLLGTVSETAAQDCLPPCGRSDALATVAKSGMRWPAFS